MDKFTEHIFFRSVPENSFIRKTVMLQFPSLPNGIVKNCYYSQKLAEERKLERENSFSFTANSVS